MILTPSIQSSRSCAFSRRFLKGVVVIVAAPRRDPRRVRGGKGFEGNPEVRRDEVRREGVTGEVEREAERRLGVGVRWRGMEGGGEVGKV
jgi:hypothetical protein